MERIITMEGIRNARDLGGLINTEGKTVTTGCLIRSASLADATDSDLNRLKEEYHLSMIVDLRTGMEVKEKPDREVPGALYISNPVFDEAMAGISHEKETDRQNMQMPDMKDLYRMIVTQESCRTNLGNAAKKIMAHDFSCGAVLWHCTEGKDRCGLLSASLLMALGVDRETVREDYLMTNIVNAPRAEQYARMVLESGKSEQEAQFVRNMILAKEEYIDSAFKAIDETYGSTESFLTDGLHIPEELITQFREKLLK